MKYFTQSLFLLVNILMLLSIFDRVTPTLASDSQILPIQLNSTPTPTLLPTTPTTPITEIPNLGSTQYQQNGVIFNNDALNNINSQNCALACLQINVKT